jgi:hypothetical protein
MLELRGGEKMAWSEAAYSTKRNVAEAMSDLTAVMLGMAQQNVTAAQSTISRNASGRSLQCNCSNPSCGRFSI